MICIKFLLNEITVVYAFLCIRVHILTMEQVITKEYTFVSAVVTQSTRRLTRISFAPLEILMMCAQSKIRVLQTNGKESTGQRNEDGQFFVDVRLRSSFRRRQLPITRFAFKLGPLCLPTRSPEAALIWNCRKIVLRRDAFHYTRSSFLASEFNKSVNISVSGFVRWVVGCWRCSEKGENFASNRVFICPAKVIYYFPWKATSSTKM